MDNLLRDAILYKKMIGTITSLHKCLRGSARQLQSWFQQKSLLVMRNPI
ncbi:MAG: hypothetical protein GQF41_1917 [Candidatus Rifleibacterium amylolyticum]|nr:MAG: hypothetical protein GQF41_1917 [Candidatus Rifleibacterium amylolyticum]